MSGFRFRTVTTTVGGAHGVPFPEPLEREVWFFEPTDAAVVLGSAQPLATLDLAEIARRGLATVRRRSGGGAVLVEADASSWFDVWLPADDEHFEPDVGRSAHWLGERIVRALRLLGVDAEGPVEVGERTRWSSLVCFAALGSGEVLSAGRKVVGISQRRTRAGARFQAMVLHRFDPAATASLFALSEPERHALTATLTDSVGVVDLDRAALRGAIEAVFAAG